MGTSRLLLDAILACGHPQELQRQSKEGDFFYVGTYPVVSSYVRVTVPDDAPDLRYTFRGRSEDVSYKIHVAPHLHCLHDTIVRVSTRLRERGIGHKIAFGKKYIEPADSQFGKIITVYPAGRPAKQAYQHAFDTLAELAKEGCAGVPLRLFSDKHDICKGMLLPETNGLAWYGVNEINTVTFGSVVVPYSDRAKALRAFASQGPLDHLIPEIALQKA